MNLRKGLNKRFPARAARGAFGLRSRFHEYTSSMTPACSHVAFFVAFFVALPLAMRAAMREVARALDLQMSCIE